MINAILVFLGAGFGGLTRYWVYRWVIGFAGNRFPYGTLLINISGSFFMGLLVVLLLDKFSDYTQPLRIFILVGFLGGFTTFSSFSIETYKLFEGGEWLSALSNITLSVVLCLLGVWLGVASAKLFHSSAATTISSTMDAGTNE